MMMPNALKSLHTQSLLRQTISSPLQAITRHIHNPSRAINLGHINIAGNGVGAFGVLRALQHNTNLRDTPYHGEITVFSPDKTIGPGLAYSAKNPSQYILNNGLDVIGGADTFQQWVNQHPGLNTQEKQFSEKLLPYPPRYLVGEYLQSYSEALIDRLSNQGFDINIKAQAATLSDYEQQRASHEEAPQHFICCTGGMSVATTPYESTLSQLGENYIRDHIKESAQLTARSRAAHNIVVLGSGLSSVDVLRHLLQDANLQKKATPITVLSRRGLLPFVRPERTPTLPPMEIDKLLNQEYLSLNSLEAAMISDLRALGAPLASHDDPLTVLRSPQNLLQHKTQETLLAEQLNEPCTEKIQKLTITNNPSPFAVLHAYLLKLDTILGSLFDNQSLSAEDQERFRARYERGVGLGVAAMPRASAQIILKALTEGQLTIKSDCKSATAEFSPSGRPTVAFHDTAGRPLAAADCVINTTGSDNRLYYPQTNDAPNNTEQHAKTDLMGSLVQAGYAKPYVRQDSKKGEVFLGGIDHNPHTGLVTRPAPNHSPLINGAHPEFTDQADGNAHLYIVGQHQKGRCYNMNSMAQIQTASEHCVQSIMETSKLHPTNQAQQTVVPLLERINWA